MNALKKSIEEAGGVAAVAAACGLSQRAIYKWLTAEALPRTEFTGETDYASRIASLAAARGCVIDPADLRAHATPKRAA
ncbi:hypothetical protein LMK08_16615 [Metapseudomonas furukawaii]|uniref:YdaS family helix-turn-helix protein n=1 Tax=Metapseudomonas furukawaii TaxID=1149133 RepID=UPI00227A1D00|nr:YdaS family helix-turn-helix protein [Pseudomonas furukawaii]WAG76998.1 hypothetical protein LMK08_16615 [Pseudomonas furukawaii]